MRLRTLLALVFAASALALTLLGTLAVSHFVAGRAQVRSEARMADLAAHLRQTIDTNIDERLGDMEVLTGVARTTAATPEARRTWAEAVRTTYPAYAWIGFADREGRVTASTGGMLEGASVAARPWFQRGLDQPAVTDVHEAKLLAKLLAALSGDEPKRFVDVSAPLRDASGAVVGVVGGHLSLSWKREMSRATIAAALAREPGVEVLILAGDGAVVLGPGDRQGERMLADLPTLTTLAAGTERATARGTWPDGRDYFTGASRALVATERPRLPWTVIVRQPVDVALAPTYAIILRLAVGGCGFVLLFTLLGWWAAERLADPLRALAGAAHGIADTPGDVCLPAPRGYTEITELTRALMGLLRRLGERDRALASANADLERRVHERTVELVEARDRAEAAQVRAEAAERAKGEFLATMSHEVRTPLNATKGFGDLLAEDTGLTPGQRRCADQMRVGCEVLTTVVIDILDFASVEAGKIVLEAVPFSPSAFVEQTVALVRGTAERKGLDLRVEVEATDDLVALGDVTRLRQVLLNLANNAVKFTPQGSVTVVLEQATTAEGIHLRVMVRDTGIGIPAEVQARLFTRFAQADSSITRRFGGTGLGLAIARGLIEAMGGTVGLESREDEGSTFWFSVTLPCADASFAVAPAPPSSSVQIAPDDRRQARLLLVEDSDINREIAQAVLERMCYRVDVARDGREALVMVQANAYDLVLMDVEMAVMDGVTATGHIRALAGPAGRLPIVAMTAHVLPELVARLRSVGMDDHIGKPFDWAHLRATIERNLRTPAGYMSAAA